ncbi:hypothetical protein MTQ10_17500 [Streptomyces sp. XM83C]|uniref:hypothetical protein n=1 Tax=Streptomyces sp. XM83C TaxID=2929781 RepID=UPI001FF91CF4|nr:hypothetical protein [Streptomyces sp. XM83C]MCK1821364.1 hypothetical protein [Streptomyces sp. XM83C]
MFCDRVTVLGDVSASLDICVQESVQPPLSERDLASAFARAAGTVVLFPAEEAPPSAYWLAREDGLVTRARLYGSDDEPRYTIDRVEDPVGRLPHVTVARIPEVVCELKIATPLADAFAANSRRMHPDEAGTLGSPAWTASDRLGAWEKLVRQMEAAWAPSGWYPPDLYGERLEVRDELEQVRTRLPQDLTVLLRDSLASLDALFVELTVDDTGGLLSARSFFRRRAPLRPTDGGGTAALNLCPGDTTDRWRRPRSSLAGPGLETFRECLRLRDAPMALRDAVLRDLPEAGASARRFPPPPLRA